MECESCEERARMEEVLKTLSKDKSFEDWYNGLAKMSQQLKECIDDLLAHGLEMRQEYNTCTKLKLSGKNEEIIQRLTKIKDLAQMESVNINVLISTIEILLQKIHGYS